MAKGLENSKKLCKLTEHLMVIVQIILVFRFNRQPRHELYGSVYKIYPENDGSSVW